MYGLARALRRAAAPGRLAAAGRGGGGAGGRPWGWGLALGLALGVKVPAGCEAGGGQEEEEAMPASSPRGFGAAIERSRDLLRRIKVLGVVQDGRRRGRGGKMAAAGPGARERFLRGARSRGGRGGCGGGALEELPC